MRNLILVVLIAFGASAAMADDGDKPLQEKASSTKAEKAYKPPPGYKTKRRGDKVVYCRKGAETGSRFSVEKCFSQEQLEVELERIANEKEEFDRSRRVCSSGEYCAGG
jgi:hypothetical protein